MFCQWIELTQWTPEQLQVAAATFKKAFGHLYLIHTSFRTDKIPLGLLGFKDGKPDWNTVRRRCESEVGQGRLVDPLCRHLEGVAMLYLGEYDASARVQEPINTLGNLRIELSACRQRVAGNPEAYYTGAGDAWIRLVQDQLASIRSRKELPEMLQPYPEAGLVALRFEIAEAAGAPSTASLARDLLARIPTSVSSDDHADWSLWPCTELPWDVLGIKRP